MSESPANAARPSASGQPGGPGRQTAPPGGTIVQGLPAPLVGLLASEEAYVADLMAILTRIAAAWSPGEFPPPFMHEVFTAVEQMYNIHSAFHSNLLANIQTPNSEPLVDVLTGWLDQLFFNTYDRFLNSLCANLDSHSQIGQLPSMAKILVTLHWPASLPSPRSGAPSPNKALYDVLFGTVGGRAGVDIYMQAPIERLAYYLQFYDRLLRSSAPDRPDYPVLARVRQLLAVLDEKSLRFRPKLATPPPPVFSSPEIPSNTVASPQLHSKQPMTIVELENSLSPDRMIDIFTMQPKKCKLQLAVGNPNRTLVGECDTVLRYVPTTTQAAVVHPDAHVFLLSDLVLFCEKIKPEERNNAQNSKMWLLFPPLSAKRLTVAGAGRDIEVTIMGKERITMTMRDQKEAQVWSNLITSCINGRPVQPIVQKKMLNQPDSKTLLQAALSLPHSAPPPIVTSLQPDAQFRSRSNPASPSRSTAHMSGNFGQQYVAAMPRSSSKQALPRPYSEQQFKTQNGGALPANESNDAIATQAGKVGVQRNVSFAQSQTPVLTLTRSVSPQPPGAYPMQNGLEQPVNPASFGVRSGASSRAESTASSTAALGAQVRSDTTLDTMLDMPEKMSIGARLASERMIVLCSMKCKSFQQVQASWKAVGVSSVKVFTPASGMNVKQCVVELDGRSTKRTVVSTIVRPDAVEKVGKTGVGIEVCNEDAERTGVVYLVQLKNEAARDSLFEALLRGSERDVKNGRQ